MVHPVTKKTALGIKSKSVCACVWPVAWLTSGQYQGDGADRVCTGYVWDGGDPVRTQRALCRSELRHLGLLGILCEQIRCVPLNALMLSLSVSERMKHLLIPAGHRAEFLLPDRSKYVNMEKRFLRSYMDLLVQTCHRRGALATGGMAALLLPSHGDSALYRTVLNTVTRQEAAAEFSSTVF